MAYVFYDTETTGTETAFDQILQFAAIKTDDDLNEIDRFEIRCRLRPDIVPAPGALVTNRVSPTVLSDGALPTHYAAVVSIRNKLLSWSPAMFIGYNSIAFDEDLLRQAFFQTLHPPYLTNTGGNSRADAMKMAYAASVYAPNSIAVPLSEKGKQTFRLEQIALLNGCDDHDAHDALGDVIATIYMARLIRQQSPEVWDAMMQSSSKHEAIDFVIDEPMVAVTERYYGNTYSWLVTYCGQNPSYDAQLGVFDLAHNPDAYLDLSVEQLIAVLNQSPKVIRSLSTNRQPIVMPASAAPSAAKGASVSQEELQRRISVIRSDGDFQERVGQALAARYADEPPSPYVEKRIYDGFPSNQDQAVMEQFHLVEWEQRWDLVQQLEDDRLQELGKRLIYLERPDALPEPEQQFVRDYINERVHSNDPEAPWTTLPVAIADVENRIATATSEEATFLDEIRLFLSKMNEQGQA